jgi:DNA-3-methyladenine glycosylase II
MSYDKIPSGDPSVRIQLPDAFNVEWMLNHIRTSSYGLPYRFVDQRVLRRALRLDGAPVVTEFDLARAGIMELRLPSDQGRSLAPGRKRTAVLEALATEARFLWGLNDDAGIYPAAMASDPRMARLLKRFGGLRIVRAPDLYEALLVAVVGQQVSVTAAQSIRRRLMQTMGRRVTVGVGPGREDYYLYPTAKEVIAAGESVLREQGLSRQKSAYMIGIARLAVNGELERDSFAALSDEDAVARLCEIKGVGRWTAEIAAMRGLGRPDILPAGDLGLQVAVQEVWAMRERPSEKALREFAGRWTGWRSYAAFYLWMTLQSRAL